MAGRVISFAHRGPVHRRHPIAGDTGPVGRAGVSPRGRVSERPGSSAVLADGPTITHDESGFTLVELLVVVLMLVTLIGIAVPTFVSQRDGAFDAAVQSDLRSAAIALESYRSQNGAYDLAATTGTSWGYVPSPDVNRVIEVTTDSYCIRGWFEPEQRDADGAVVPRSSETTDADLKAEWAITPGGMTYVGDAGVTRSCA